MILVTGATGFVGRHVAARLAGEGEKVRCLVRDTTKAAKVLPAQAELVAGDVLQPESLAAACQGVDTIVHAAFMTANLKQHGQQTYHNVNVNGTRNLVAAAKAAGARRIVVASGLGTKPDEHDRYVQGRYAAEELVKGSGLAWSIIQPSVLFGPGAPFFTGLSDLIRQVPLVVPVAGTGKETFQPIWVEDVATCMLQQARGQHDGQSIAVGGPAIYTYSQILDMLMGALHVRKTKLPGPKPFVWLGAALMEAVLPHPPITRAALGLFAFPNVTALDAVPRHFGFQPMNFQTYLAEHSVV
jgi:NADH dehydrogenase